MFVSSNNIYLVPKCSSQADFYIVILTYDWEKSQISVGLGPYWPWSLLALVPIVLGPPYWPWSLEGASYWPWSLLSLVLPIGLGP